MFTDTTKRCIVIEPKRRELIYHENPYNVMTNSLGFESHTNPMIYQLGFDDIEDVHKRQEFFLDLDFIVEKLI